MKLLTVALLVLAGTVRADITYDVDVTPHLEKLSGPRYPIETNRAEREKVRNYIRERLVYYGLDVQDQRFNTTINTDPRGLTSEQILVEGTNVIGIKPAVTEHPGAVIVVGADYDSNGVDSPLFRNGAGVAALLEVARLYAINAAWSHRFVANYTTIFVAFDINTKLHQGSPGQPGGHFFVQEWLLPFIKNNVGYFGGAVILDSIMNVNYNENSQILSTDFQNIFPDTYKRLQESGSKGDFLAMVSIGEQDENLKLKDQFSGSYNMDRRARPFRLEDMKLRNGMTFDPIVQQFVKSENIHFWTFKDSSGTTTQLPALLLTDTSSFRVDPAINCPSTPCRPKDLVTEERIAFVDATVKATTHFLFNRQATLLPDEPASAVSSLPSVLMTAVMLLLVRLYM